MTRQADLINYVFDGLQNRSDVSLLTGELLAWMDASSRFTDFVETYRDKIRKKIRVTRDPESVLDVRGELETAYRLLNDRRFALAYEPYASAKIRGPDFAVTHRANLVFNIEVARMRPEEGAASDDPKSRVEERVIRLLLYKLGQMQPSKANLLVIQVRANLAQMIDLARVMQTLKTRVESKDQALYSDRHYAGPADFYKDFLHLSAIAVWSPEAACQLWVNKQSRPALDEKVLRLVSTALLV